MRILSFSKVIDKQQGRYLRSLDLLPIHFMGYGLILHSDHIENKGIKIKDTMYFAPSMKDFTQYILPEKLKQDRGSDPSWKNDQEPPPEALDFSDDEKEKEAKQRKKSQIQGRKKLKSELNESGEYIVSV